MADYDVNKDHGGVIRTESSWGFYLLVFYLLVDFARVQDLVPVVGYFRPGLLSMMLMALFVFGKGDFGFRYNEMRLIWYFLLLLCCHIPFATNNFYAYRTAKSFAMFFPFMLTILLCVVDIKKLKLLINFIVGISIYISFSALTNVGKGTGGYFNDENDLSLYLNIIVPICYYLLSQKGLAFGKKLYYGICLCMSLAAIVVSFSRGGFIGLLAVSSFIWLFGKNKFRTALVVFIIAISLYIFGGDTYWSEMGTVTDTKESTAQARLQSWAAGWRMFLDNPLGVGGNNFQVRFPEYQGEWFSRGMWGRVAHSLWFTLLSELGIIGVYLYGRLMFLVIKRLLRVMEMSYGGGYFENCEYLRCLSTGVLVGLVGFFASGSFLSVLYYPYFWYFSVIVITISNIAKMEVQAVSNV